MRADIRPQQFFSRLVAQHAHHGVVYIQKLSVRRGKKQSFLNAVEQLAVSPFRFAPVGNVFQHVNRARLFFGGPGRPRSGH